MTDMKGNDDGEDKEWQQRGEQQIQKGRRTTIKRKEKDDRDDQKGQQHTANEKG